MVDKRKIILYIKVNKVITGYNCNKNEVKSYDYTHWNDQR